jgi:hypothetical protein
MMHAWKEHVQLSLGWRLSKCCIVSSNLHDGRQQQAHVIVKMARVCMVHVLPYKALYISTSAQTSSPATTTVGVTLSLHAGLYSALWGRASKVNMLIMPHVDMLHSRQYGDAHY